MFGARVETNLRAGGIDAQPHRSRGAPRSCRATPIGPQTRCARAVKQPCAALEALSSRNSQQMGARQMQNPPECELRAQQRLADLNNGMHAFDRARRAGQPRP